MNSTAAIKIINVKSTRFGNIEVAEDKVIYFASGLPGFKDIRRFVMLDHDDEGLFKWLQSVDDPAIAFLLTDPNLYRPGYTVPLKKPEMESLRIRDRKDLVILVMVCVSRPEGKLSLNLKGPVVFNSANMTAMQCIIDREDYPSHFHINA